MQNLYDVIIVGGRLAGAATAYELSKKGYKILLLERSQFPSDILSTHNFFNNSLLMLKEMGVLGKLLATGTPTYNRAFIQFDEEVIDGSFPVVDGEPNCLCIRRTHLDQILFEHAIKQENVTALQKFRVTDILMENGTVAGIQAIDPNGSTVEFRAKLVIGADGRNSTIRKKVNSEKWKSVPTDFASYVGYVKNFIQKGERCAEFYKVKDKLIIAFPTSDQLHVIGIMFPLEDKEWMERFKVNPEGAFRALVDFGFGNTDFPERLQGADFTGKVKGLLGYDNDWYNGMGPGWALVGDALSFKDPAVGQGMHDGLYGARILAEVLCQHQDWSMNWEKMADQYNQRMNEKMLSRFEMACQFTKNRLFTEEQHLVNRLIGMNPDLTQTFLGLYNYANEPKDLESKIQSMIESGR
ncbi:NAD(P)/FAD-dependent oxidoreductase [Neobacillus sp. SuZ13]|uniref:NAD(P)/FAD-dependent oxidoreductase n=1 Tax=Neobacillus sp. SuZ13 TaxID=3047875 RepID=UPI0024C0BA4E|nr:NAD(P)/FAD-dependent oxidoreductase [Neobacillus sp. SuZ13]WHY67724.1 NAD(P)/FAD-dependent oxidoreductase [Neobacillus sp. SuZ13]